ncbi:MAG: hypothetical protein ACRBDL_09135 [Alphaproteobacteria bacterium]
MSFINRWLIIAFLFFLTLTVWVYRLYQGCGIYPEWEACLFDNNILGSFFASALEDIIFFGSVGLIIFFASLPNKHDVEARLSYLYRKKIVSDSLLSFVKEEAKNLGICTKEQKVTYTISEYSKQHQAFKVYVGINSKLLNLIEGAAYESSRQIKMTFDRLLRKKEDTVYGELLNVQSVVGEKGFVTQPNTNFPVPFTEIEGGFEILEKVDGKQKRSTVTQIYYWLWVNNKSEFWYRPYRNTEKFSLTIVNQLDEPVSIMNAGLGKGTNAVKSQVAPRGTIELCSDITMRNSDLYLISLEKHEE